MDIQDVLSQQKSFLFLLASSYKKLAESDGIMICDKISAIIWLVVYFSVLIFGFVSQKDYSTYETRTIALVQTNSDPWVGGEEAYKKDLNVLMNLSDEALNSNPNISFVVWPETAFVPRIQWHYEKRLNRNSFNLVNTLLTYLDSKPVPFVIGNDDGVMGYDSEGNYTLLDYNAALVFTPKENVREMLRLCEKYGVMITTGSDAHLDLDVGMFPNVYSIIEECNFPEELIATTSFEKIKPFLNRYK